MSGFRDYLRGIGALFSDVAVCVLVLSLLPLLPGISVVWIPVFTWGGFLAVQLLVNLVLIGRGISMNAYLIWNGAAIFTGAFLVGQNAVCPECMGIFAGITAVCAAAAGIHGAYAAWAVPGANGLLRYVDGLVILLAFYLYAAYDSGWGVNRETAALAVGMMVLDLFLVSRIRTNEGDTNIIRGAGAGSRLALILIVLGIVGVTGGVIGFASGQIHDAVDLLLWFLTVAAKVLDVIFLIIGTVIGWLVILLVYLFPATPPRAKENVRNMLQESVDEIVEETGFMLPAWVWPVLGVILIIIVAAWILFIFRNVKLNRTRAVLKTQKAVRKSFVLSKLHTLLLRAKEAAVFEMQYRKNRRTLTGLLIFADRLGSQVKWKENERRESLGRRKEEGPGEYIRRLALHVLQIPGGEEKDAECLRGLAQLMDESYYCGLEVSVSKEECIKYEEVLKKYARTRK